MVLSYVQALISHYQTLTLGLIRVWGLHETTYLSEQEKKENEAHPLHFNRD